MTALYKCPKCKIKKKINSIGAQPHFKIPTCDKCKRTMHQRKIL